MYLKYVFKRKLLLLLFHGKIIRHKKLFLIFLLLDYWLDIFFHQLDHESIECIEDVIPLHFLNFWLNYRFQNEGTHRLIIESCKKEVSISGELHPELLCLLHS